MLSSRITLYGFFFLLGLTCTVYIRHNGLSIQPRPAARELRIEDFNRFLFNNWNIRNVVKRSAETKDDANNEKVNSRSESVVGKVVNNDDDAPNNENKGTGKLSFTGQKSLPEGEKGFPESEKSHATLETTTPESETATPEAEAETTPVARGTAVTDGTPNGQNDSEKESVIVKGVTPEFHSKKEGTPAIESGLKRELSTRQPEPEDLSKENNGGETQPEPEPEPEPEPGDGHSGIVAGEPELFGRGNGSHGNQTAYTAGCAEPEPVWSIAKPLWGIAWELHVYGVGVAFACLALFSLVAIIRLSFHKKLLSQGYFLSLNIVMFIMGACRATLFLVDGYNANGVFPQALGCFLYTVAFPCLTSTFSILFMALLKTLRMQLISARIERPCVLIAIIAFHFSFSIFTDIMVATFMSAKVLYFVCQWLFVIFSTFLILGYFYVFRKLYASAKRRQREMKKSQMVALHYGGKLPNFGPATSTAVRVTLAISLLGVLCVALQIYGMFGPTSVFRREPPDPWPWWSVQLAARLTELSMAALMSFVATQPLRQGPHRTCWPGCCPEKPQGDDDDETVTGGEHTTFHVIQGPKTELHFYDVTRERRQTVASIDLDDSTKSPERAVINMNPLNGSLSPQSPESAQLTAYATPGADAPGRIYRDSTPEFVM